MFYCEQDLLANLIVLSPQNARKKFRDQIFEEWNWECAYCSEKLSPETATIDHIIPKSKGGHNVKSNLCCCCSSCNKLKGSYRIDDWYTDQHPDFCEKRLVKLKTWMEVKPTSFRITSIPSAELSVKNDLYV